MRRRALIAIAALFAVPLIAACDPLPVPVTNDAPCYVNTWTMTGDEIADAVSSLGVDVTLVPTGAGTGARASITEDGHWSVYADQAFDVDAIGGAVHGSANVRAHASGTYTATDTALEFTLDDASGTVQYTGTFFGLHVTDYNLSLDDVGVERVYGWSATAQYTCRADGLTLEFPAFTLDL